MRAAISKVSSRWFVLKLSGMSTIMREWAALHCIGHLPLRDVLLSAKVRAGTPHCLLTFRSSAPTVP